MQEFQLITDASCFEAILVPEQDDYILSLGACIIRASKNREISPCNNKILYLFPARNSAHAELIIGIKALNYIISESASTCRVRWYCDLPYLPALLKNFTENPIENRSPLFEELGALINLMKKVELEIKTPETSQSRHYHSLCHRACRMLRPEVIQAVNSHRKDLVTLENFFQEIEVLVCSFLSRKKSTWMLQTAS